MRKLGIPYLLITVLGLCLTTAGCVQGFRTHKRAEPPTTQAPGIAQVSDLDKDHALPSVKSPPVSGISKSSDRANLAGARLVLHEESEPLASDGTEAPPLPAQFAQAQTVEPEVLPVPKALPPEGKSSQPKAVEQQSTPPAATPPARSETPAAKPANQSVAKPAEQPSGKQAASANAEPLITLHVDNLEVSKVMELISRQAKILNILVSPGVTGTVTLDLRNKTVDDALQIIAKQCRLTVRREKDVIYIATLDEFRKIEEDDLPIRVYHLNYVKSGDVIKMVKPILSKKGTISQSPDSDTGYPATSANAPSGTGGGAASGASGKAGGNSMAGGEIVVVQDYEINLKTIDRVIAEIDIQPTQVLIEAVIVSVTLSKDLDLGVNYAVLDNAGNALGVVGDGALINTAAGFTPAGVLASPVANSFRQTTTNGATTTTETTGSTGKVSAGFVNATDPGGVKFGWTGKNVTGFITALQKRGETKVLAAPRILVLNKQGAVVHLGQNLGYYTTQITQTSSTQTANFMPIGTQLQLRPFVSSDGMIRMEVHPQRSTGALENGLPQTTAAEVTTNVMVPNGTTIVIGGLIDTQVEHSVNGIPVLMDLPWLGGLFRESSDTKTRRELVVILTPHIWRPQCPTALNALGKPRALGLEKHTTQKGKAETEPTVYDLTATPETVDPPPADGTAAAITGRKNSTNAKVK